MLIPIIAILLLVVCLTSWILLVRLGNLKREAQTSELDRDHHNLNVRYSVGEFSPEEYQEHRESLMQRHPSSRSSKKTT